MNHRNLVRFNERERRKENSKNQREKRVEKMKKELYPRYVNFKGTILIKRESAEGDFVDYYCYNGYWSLDVYLEKNNWGERYLVSKRSEHFTTSVRVVKSTEEEWVNCVGVYRPKGIKLVDGEIVDGKYVSFDKQLVDNVVNKWDYNPCAEISLGESQPCVLFAPTEENNDRLMYILIG